MSTTDPLPTDDELVPLELRVKPIADELEEVRARIKDLQAREKELTGEVRDMVPGDGLFGPIEVNTPRTLDAAGKRALAEAYPVQTHPYLYALEVDLAKAKAHLSDAVLDGFKNPGTPRVSVKR